MLSLALAAVMSVLSVPTAKADDPDDALNALMMGGSFMPTPSVEWQDRIITDYCVLDVTPDGLELVEVAPGVTAEQVQEMTEPRLIVNGTPKEIAA